MEHFGSRESDVDFDLETGETESSSEEDSSVESSSDSKHSKRLLSRGRSGYLRIDGSLTASDGVCTNNENSYLLGRSASKMAQGGTEQRMLNKQKIKGSKKHPKPPRPPVGPLLHAADIELVKEISKRARLRRARRERKNALRKMKTDKGSSNTNFVAIIVTTIFFFVIIFQGVLGARA